MSTSSTTAAPAAAPPGTAAHRAEPRASQATGALTLLRFALRRDRVRLPVWVAAAAGFVAVQSSASQRTYDTPEAIAGYAEVAQANAAVIAMTGRPVGIETVERAVAFEIFAFVAILVGLMSVFAVVRHTRADEAEGRTELVRAAAVGRWAPLLAGVGTAVVANLGVVGAVWLAGVGTGLPSAGSLLLGVSLGAVGLAFAGLAALLAQLVESSRAASGLGGLAVALAFVLRGAGDVREDALSWLSPIGWGQATYPFWLDRWWPLLLCLALAAACVGLAFVVLGRRDLGAGLVRARPGRAAAGPLLRGPLTLAGRLQRGTVLGWTFGVVGTGVVYGSLVDATADLVEQAPEILEVLPGGADDIVDGYLVITVVFLAVLAASAAVAMVLRLRTEEEAGRAEPVLATPVSRWAWAGSHTLVALLAPAAALLLGGLACGLVAVGTGAEPRVVSDLVVATALAVPGVWVLAALALALWGLDARLAPAAWLAVVWSGVVLLLAESLDLPGCARDLSPLHHVPQVPVEDPTLTGPLVLTAVAAVLVVTGLLGFRRRDLRTG